MKGSRIRATVKLGQLERGKSERTTSGAQGKEMGERTNKNKVV